MATSETSSNENNPNALQEHTNSGSAPDHLAQNLKSQWGAWSLDVSKNLQPIFKETVVFVTFILGDLLIVWLAGFALADVTRKVAVIEWLYDGIRIASAIVITIQYVCQCIIEINKSRVDLMSKVFPKNDQKKEETV